MHLRSYVIDNGGVDWHLSWYGCDRCGTEIHSSHPHFSDKPNNIQFCWECSFAEGKITEKECLAHSAVGWMKDAHASIVDGKVIIWVGKRAPWERKNNEFRRTRDYRIWRNKVLTRDGNKCRHCSVETKLQAHHIKPFATYTKQRFKVSNGLTLCEKCHKAEHKRLKQGDPIVRRISNK